MRRSEAEIKQAADVKTYVLVNCSYSHTKFVVGLAKKHKTQEKMEVSYAFVCMNPQESSLELAMNRQ